MSLLNESKVILPAKGSIHADFCQDVFERLQKHKPHMYGCPLIAVEALLTGDVHLVFAGLRTYIGETTPRFWSGKFKFRGKYLQDKQILGDPNAVVETALKLLDQHGFLIKIPGEKVEPAA